MQEGVRPFKVVLQRGDADCSVAAMAMLLRVEYEQALIALSHESPHILTRGVWIRHIEAAAQQLGWAIKRKRRYNLTRDEGMLNLTSPRWPSKHVVVLRAGSIFETDGTVYQTNEYFGVTRAKPGMLLVAERL